MLSVKKVFCVSLLHYFVCGNILQNQISSHELYTFTKAPNDIPVSTPSKPQCAPEKSLNSRDDIKVLIDHVYNETFLDKKIKENYQSKAEAIRDKHLQDLTHFTAWFDNQPEHLKHVLQRLDSLRKERVEPIVKNVSGVLSEYPKLEMSYHEKNNKANELKSKLDRYKMICKINDCEDQQKLELIRTKRNVQNDFYCCSLKDLFKEITENLDESVKELNSTTLSDLDLVDKKYAEKIDEIKSKLRDKALKEFGRTMYDILSLEDEYHHFVNDINSVDLDAAVYNIKKLGLQVDEKLFQLEQAIEKFGQHCKSCGSKTLARYVRRADLQSEVKTKKESPVSQLIEIKVDEIKAEVETDFNRIFDDLDTLIQKTEAEKESLEKLKPIQNEINSMTNSEKEALSKLKNLKLKPSVENLFDLLKKIMDLLKLILDLLHKLPIPV